MEDTTTVDVELQTEEPAFSFIKDLHESRMTKDNGSSRKLTYSDCCERLYLTLLILETMRQFPDFTGPVKRYADDPFAPTLQVT